MYCYDMSRRRFHLRGKPNNIIFVTSYQICTLWVENIWFSAMSDGQYKCL